MSVSVQVPDVLDLAPILLKHSAVATTSDVKDDEKEDESPLHVDDCVYELCTVLSHHGYSAHVGHFTADIWDDERLVWWKMDDETVSQVASSVVSRRKCTCGSVQPDSILRCIAEGAVPKTEEEDQEERLNRTALRLSKLDESTSGSDHTGMGSEPVRSINASAAVPTPTSGSAAGTHVNHQPSTPSPPKSNSPRTSSLAQSSPPSDSPSPSTSTEPSTAGACQSTASCVPRRPPLRCGLGRASKRRRVPQVNSSWTNSNETGQRLRKPFTPPRPSGLARSPGSSPLSRTGSTERKSPYRIAEIWQPQFQGRRLSQGGEEAAKDEDNPDDAMTGKSKVRDMGESSVGVGEEGLQVEKEAGAEVESKSAAGKAKGQDGFGCGDVVMRKGDDTDDRGSSMSSRPPNPAEVTSIQEESHEEPLDPHLESWCSSLWEQFTDSKHVGDLECKDQLQWERRRRHGGLQTSGTRNGYMLVYRRVDRERAREWRKSVFSRCLTQEEKASPDGASLDMKGDNIEGGKSEEVKRGVTSDSHASGAPKSEVKVGKAHMRKLYFSTCFLKFPVFALPPCPRPVQERLIEQGKLDASFREPTPTLAKSPAEEESKGDSEAPLVDLSQDAEEVVEGEKGEGNDKGMEKGKGKPNAEKDSVPTNPPSVALRSLDETLASFTNVFNDWVDSYDPAGEASDNQDFSSCSYPPPLVSEVFKESTELYQRCVAFAAAKEKLE